MRCTARQIFLAVVLEAFSLSLVGCGAKSPVPPEVLERIKAEVENDGRPAPAPADVFSMPGGVAPVVNPTPADKVTVNEMIYSTTQPPLSREIAGIPAGTVMYYYRVRGTRTKPDGSGRAFTRLFYVWPDAGGGWRFLENKNASSAQYE